MPGLIDLGSAFAPIINKVLDFIPDPAAKAAAQAAAAQAAMQAQLQMNQAQLAVDQAEANNANIFVAGWRPAIGWCGAAGVAWAYVFTPAIEVVQAVARGLPVPPVDTSALMQLVLAMLGMGALRTVEKVNGVAAKTAK